MNKNEPILFIDSVSINKEGRENQETYDSRNPCAKKNVKHRIIDLSAMLIYQIKVYCEIKTRNRSYMGYVKEVTNQSIILEQNKEVEEIKIFDIESINILKI